MIKETFFDEEYNIYDMCEVIADFLIDLELTPSNFDEIDIEHVDDKDFVPTIVNHIKTFYQNDINQYLIDYDIIKRKRGYKKSEKNKYYRKANAIMQEYKNIDIKKIEREDYNKLYYIAQKLNITVQDLISEFKN